MRDVGQLFLHLGLAPVGYRKKYGGLGEIDLIFKLQRPGILIVLFVDVSDDSTDQNQKIGHFFSRWTDLANLDLLLRDLDLRGAKNLRIYVDMSRESSDAKLSSIGHHLGRTDLPNHVLFKDDIRYFQKGAESIGKWAKSDLLSFLKVPMSPTSIHVDAIQFYLDDIPVFSFVCDVGTLLDACYISRRLDDRRGYQRALNQDRMKNIEQEISDRKIVAFPNSILINCESLLIDSPVPVHECPKLVRVSLPTSYCSCCVVDGQHRLLGFSKLDETQLSQRHLPVVAFQKLPPDKEIKMFIDINSKQKRIDSNLIEDLKADFEWDPSKNRKEFAGRIIVLIAREIDKNGPLRRRIFFGGAKDKKADKITLTTFVTVLRENQLIGGSNHFWQSDPRSTLIGEPLEKAKGFFSKLLEIFHSDTEAGGFLLENIGLRVLFRTVQVLERNKRAGSCVIETPDFLRDLRSVLDKNMIKELENLYGGGGGAKGAVALISALEKKHPKYGQLELDFRRLSRTNLSRLTPLRSERN